MAPWDVLENVGDLIGLVARHLVRPASMLYLLFVGVPSAALSAGAGLYLLKLPLLEIPPFLVEPGLRLLYAYMSIAVVLQAALIMTLAVAGELKARITLIILALWALIALALKLAGVAGQLSAYNILGITAFFLTTAALAWQYKDYEPGRW